MEFFNLEGNQEGVSLTWSTAQEIGTDHFVIERSIEGINFKPIGKVSAVGVSATSQGYRFKDKQPTYGDNYYRLRMVDLDGSFTYSNIRTIRSQVSDPQLIVFPNPARGEERLKITWFSQANQKRAYLNIVDINGQNFARKFIFEGTNFIRLPKLIDGIYYVIIEDYFGGFLLERVVIIN